MQVRAGDDHVHLQLHKFGRKVRQPLHVTIRLPALDDEVAALDVAEIAQPIFERVEQRRNRLGRRPQEKAHPIHLRGRLRLGNGSRDDDAARDSADESPPIHIGSPSCRTKIAP